MVAITPVTKNSLRCQNGVMVNDSFAFKRLCDLVTECQGANLNDEKMVRNGTLHETLRLYNINVAVGVNIVEEHAIRRNQLANSNTECNFLGFFSGFSFMNIHESRDSRERGYQFLPVFS